MALFVMDDFVEDLSKEKVNLLCGIIENLYKKYDDDPFMTSKIHHYITHQLPVLLDTIQETRERNKQRTNEHQDEHQRFINQFLSQCKYYYNQSNETFFGYNGTHYTNTCEDNILHHIVCTISHERNPKLMNWKHKTKVSLLKKIKEQLITKVIPESETIQLVLKQFHQTICATKTEAKYLLTVIGDNILKKQTSLIHFITPQAKCFLRTLNQICIENFNVQCIQTFKYKYHEKQVGTDSRMIHVLPMIEHQSWCESTLKYCGLDMLCVACHYSHKYGCSDDYANDFSQDVEMQQYVFRMKYTKAEEIITQFVQEYLINFRPPDTTSATSAQISLSVSPPEEYFMQSKKGVQSDHYSLTLKQMQYLWKEYLGIHNYPIGLYNLICKKMLIETVFPSQYNAEHDIFVDVGSSQLPLIQKFLKFWSETSIDDPNEYAELELEEIGILFRNWLQFNNQQQNHNSSHQRKKKYLLKEDKIVDILNYFHPELEIVKDKYIIHTRNVLWDKDVDIELALFNLREGNTAETNNRTISLYNAYLYYCKFYSTHLIEAKSKPLLVSKSYFERYVRAKYGLFLDANDTFFEVWFEG